MEVKTVTYLNEAGELSPACTHTIPKEKLLQGYRTMVLSQLVDEKTLILQRQGAISFSISARGEEGCIVASAAALDFADWIYPQYREMGALFWRDYPIQDYMHHMFCNGEDAILGRQMPNHFGSRTKNVVTVSSAIGTKIPHAAGCAYAMKLQKEPQIALSYFGDGATSEGDFHVGLNFAAVRKAPVLFFCRNNAYAISTTLENQFASDGIAPKGIGYGMKTYRVDGNDYFAVHETVTKARTHCLEKGPVLIEALTYRMGAHTTSDDPSCYRDEEEVKLWEKKCPIKRLRLYLENQGLWDAAQEEDLRQSIQKEIDQAVQKAEKAPPPPDHTLIDDVYFEIPEALEEQYQERLTACECHADQK